MQSRIAKEFGISRQAVSKILSGRIRNEAVKSRAEELVREHAVRTEAEGLRLRLQSLTNEELLAGFRSWPVEEDEQTAAYVESHLRPCNHWDLRCPEYYEAAACCFARAAHNNFALARALRQRAEVTPES